MKTAGKLAGEIELEDGAPRSVDLTLDELTFDDGARTFALESLTGAVHWRSDDQGKSDDSILRWSGGALLGLAVGASEMQFNGSGRQFRLLQPTRIPLLDGALALESFRIRNAGLPSVAFMVDAALEPIDVKRLCQAFGWPEFGGRLGGTLLQAAHARRRRNARHDAERAGVRRRRHASAICGCRIRSASGRGFPPTSRSTISTWS